MFETIALALYCFLVIGTAVLFLKVRGRLRSRREQRDYETLKREHPERVYGTPEYWIRFSHPDFSALETHLGKPLPDAFKRLATDSEAVRATDFELIPPDSDSPADRWPVICFFPADAQAIIDLWPAYMLTPGQLPFATDGAGGLYYLELGDPPENDPPVYYYHWDGEIRARTAESLSEFLSWPRVSLVAASITKG